MAESRMISVLIKPEDVERLDALAEKEGHTRSSMIRHLVVRRLDEAESKANTAA